MNGQRQFVAKRVSHCKVVKHRQRWLEQAGQMFLLGLLSSNLGWDHPL